ncbi:MAG TPA: NAD(P)H-quinone oxidoreductase [Aeromicrobium sp.]|nr:NAD(P)H-quinone oxidoreductase [Aeromicrobium sp.]
MRAVIAPEPGGPEALQLVERPVPEPAEGEVLIGVEAVGLNRADILQRQGFYPPPPGISDVLGLECAGTISALGPGVSGFSVGDHVCALLAGGAYADFAVVPAGQVAPIPPGLSVVEAAAFMETSCTVWSNLVMVAGLSVDETLLVHGGTSGIGTMAIQVAKALAVRVVTTVGSEEKVAAARDLGADIVINYRTEDFAEALASEGIAADVILDIIGAKYLAANISTLAPNGRLVIIGLQGGIQAELNLAALLAKRASVTATSLRARPLEEKAEIVGQTMRHVGPMLADGSVRPIVHATFDISEVADAHRLLESSTHVGKVVLTL